MTGARLKIAEIFHSIQGEASFAGRPCVFVRLTGCQMRCAWCDTAYAFHGGEWRTLDEIVAAVRAFGCPLVEITGGEPLLQPDVLPLMTRLCDEGFEVLLETGGGLDIAPVDRRVRRIVDVKCPGSGEAAGNRWENLDDLRPGDELKFVVADRADYEWARETIAARSLGGRCPIHLAPVWGAVAPAELAAWILADRLNVRLSLQLHKLLWGAEARGV
ncbi:MAG: radical SAM protein [Thermoanaerobaculia bacterium]|nr:MAG: radical SAM protein [Thermoanaerobaculia bacterium]